MDKMALVDARLVWGDTLTTKPDIMMFDAFRLVAVTVTRKQRVAILGSLLSKRLFYPCKLLPSGFQRPPPCMTFR
jgi:hypothetical protein